MEEHCSRHLRLSATGLEVLVIELSDGISVDELPIKFRGYVVIGIDPTGFHSDDELTLPANVPDVGYAGGFYSVQRDIAAADVVKEGVGDVELG